jgi:heat shock protein HslJ
MIRSLALRVSLAATLALVSSAATTAQEPEDTPEGVDWHLSSYAQDDSASVPWTVDPTLRLDDGNASGSTGCNDFSTSYSLEAETLAIEPTVAMTRRACPEPAATVEDAYLAALPEVTAWSVDGDVLELSADDGTVILTYERAVVALTAGDVDQLTTLLEAQQEAIDRLGERIDNVRIGTLRDRIKELESEVAALQAAGSASSSAGSSGFDSAENVLLQAIPRKVAKTCRPLRSGLPAGTVAAVACDGSRKAVASQAYYLMEWADAEATLASVARARGVPERRPRCQAQKAGWISYGTALGAEACWIESGKANYRLITRAAGCRQLDVAGTRLTEPAIYLAMEGVNRKMEPVRAAGLAYTDADYLIMNMEAGGYIPADGQPRTPACRNL